MRVSTLRSRSQTKLTTAALRTSRRFFPAIFTAFRRLLLLGSARRCLLASSLYCHAVFISASTPGPAHQTRAPRGRLEHGNNSAAVESMTSAMSVVMSLMQVPKVRVSHQPPKVGRLRSFLGTVYLPPVWCGPAWDADFRVHEIVIRFWCL